MFRQRFLPEYEHLSYGLGAKDLKARPKLSAAIGNCLGIWSYVDQEMGCIFGHLLGTGAQAAIQVFMILRQSARQREALEEAAKYALPPEAKCAFDALLNLYKNHEHARNDLAHGCFGIVAENEDILLWTAIKDHVNFLTDAAFREKSGKERSDRHELLKQNMFVYKLSDLERLYSQNGGSMDRCISYR